MEVTDEMLMALADGELDPAMVGQLNALVAADPELQRRLAVFTGTARLLRAAMAPGPVPDRLVRAIVEAPADGSMQRPGPVAGNVVPLAPRRRWAAGIGLAAAMAALAFGMGGYMLGRTAGEDAPLAARLTDASEAAWATLATGEEVVLPGGARLRMLGSYETDQGLCRMGSTDGAAASGAVQEREIRCLDGADWRLALRAEVPAGQGFQPASDLLSGMADHWLDGAGAGPALDAGAEQEALSGGAANPVRP
ncbi:anti-sigma factor family protein [Pseudogemmobacter bohemicus]|uniref:anti-sigma factor family protein n=1 Tax=Pseudogemmobacter bohemicus TaxID=2250708 RepID=UPI000DD4B8E3|nr:hypothetical protein [Pseudogemmobacter bohemicus]